MKDIVSFSVILLIATIVFSSSIVINRNVSKDYDNEFNKLNTASTFDLCYEGTNPKNSNEVGIGSKIYEIFPYKNRKTIEKKMFL